MSASILKIKYEPEIPMTMSLFLPMLALLIVVLFFITQRRPPILTRAKSQILTRGMFALFWAIIVGILLITKYRNGEEDIQLSNRDLPLFVAVFCVLLNLARMYSSWSSSQQQLPARPPVIDSERNQTKPPSAEYLPEFDFTKPSATQEPDSDPKKSGNM